jgi:hypothetical protein
MMSNKIIIYKHNYLDKMFYLDVYPNVQLGSNTDDTFNFI